ncbi:MAG: hypothetical protein ACOZDY_08895 [Pseudomonadota bacterium]
MDIVELILQYSVLRAEARAELEKTLGAGQAQEFEIDCYLEARGFGDAELDNWELSQMLKLLENDRADRRGTARAEPRQEASC